MPSLDIGANSFRQNGSIKDDHALVAEEIKTCIALVGSHKKARACQSLNDKL